MRILLVEDDSMLGAATQLALRDAAHAVDWVRDGQSALSALLGTRYEAVLLDLGLPKRDGLTVLGELRARHDPTPVIVLTARGGIEDRVRGLDAGADDYLIKPFATDELLARLRALARRKGGQGQPLLSNGILELDPATHEASRGGQADGADGAGGADGATRLSAREYALLHALMTRPGAILSRADLEERIYGWNEEVESNAVEFLIRSLRKKLGQDAIKNVRGAGWMVDRNAHGTGQPT